MLELDYIYADQIPHGATMARSFGCVPSFSTGLLWEYAALRDRLIRAQAELAQQMLSVPVLDPLCLVDAEFGGNAWLQSVIGDMGSSTSIVAVTPSAIKTWRQWWCSARIRAARLGKKISALSNYLRVLNQTLRSLFTSLGHSSFSHHLVCRQRAWCLLHGSHPPRKHAGADRPVFAETLGRVCRAPVF
jgi:hypothetical protein